MQIDLKFQWNSQDGKSHLDLGAQNPVSSVHNQIIEVEAANIPAVSRSARIPQAD